MRIQIERTIIHDHLNVLMVSVYYRNGGSAGLASAGT